MYILDRIASSTLLLCSLVLLTACQYANNDGPASHAISKVEAAMTSDVIVGADRVGLYHPLLEGKRVAAVVNQTSKVGSVHLVDTLLQLNIDIKKIFAPEHGFRGDADAGQVITDGTDPLTNLPIVSLYGKNKKPSQQQLAGIDIVVFDIQDVGARFYTYISTLHYVMEACAEAGIPVLVLDRPNPNAHYVDGPILEAEYKSFVGMHPVPVVYGMTIGEYAQMINGEQWLADGLQAELTVVPCNNYDHDTYYELPVRPSPNLPNSRSVLLYPSLCFFEGTTVSVGRGTQQQFQVYGHPEYTMGSAQFTPKPMHGAKYPKHQAKACMGHDLSHATIGSLRDRKQLDLTYLLDMYRDLSGSDVSFFNDNNFFEKLAGTATLRRQILGGATEEEIRASWQTDLHDFGLVRARYLMYSQNEGH